MYPIPSFRHTYYSIRRYFNLHSIEENENKAFGGQQGDASFAYTKYALDRLPHFHFHLLFLSYYRRNTRSTTHLHQRHAEEHNLIQNTKYPILRRTETIIGKPCHSYPCLLF